MTNTIQHRICSLGLAALAISCGNQSLELSAPPKIQPSMDPKTVGSINEQVGWLTVDDERLYWMGTIVWPNLDFSSDQTGTALRSCKKDHCSDSLVTYDASNVDLSSGFGLHDGQIYWRAVTKLPAFSFAIVACPTSGCVAPRRVLLSNETSPNRFALGADGLYVSGGTGFLRIPYTGAGSPVQLGSVYTGTAAVAVHGDFVYWLGASATSGRSALYRTRADVSSKTETLADQLKILTTSGAQNAAAITYVSLAFDETYVYWTENTLTGSLMRCPLAGCSGSAEVIAAPIRAPLNLRPDGERAYFQYEDNLLGNSLASCSLARCEPSAPIVHGLDGWNAMAIDDRYVYAATTDQMPNPDQPWDAPSSHIRRFPK